MDIATTEMAIKIAIKSPFRGVTKKTQQFHIKQFRWENENENVFFLLLRTRMFLSLLTGNK